MSIFYERRRGAHCVEDFFVTLCERLRCRFG